MTGGCGDQSTRWTLTALSEVRGREGLGFVKGVAQIIATSSSVAYQITILTDSGDIHTAAG